jgi:hypothetical protein
MTHLQAKLATLNARTLEDFQLIARARGYSDGWAYRKYGAHLDQQEATREWFTAVNNRLKKTLRGAA